MSPSDASTPSEPSLSSHEIKRRNLAALPLAMSTFTLAYVGMFFTLPWLEPAGDGGWAALGYFVGLMILGAALVVVVIPAVVFTLGRRLDRATRTAGTARASVAFAAAGLALGLVLALLMSWAANVSVLGASANITVPAAVGGAATRLLLEPALNYRWVAVLSWVLAVLPVVGAIALVIAWVAP